MAEVEDTIRRSIDVWNARDHDGWLAVCGEGTQFEAPGGFAGEGPEMARLFWSLWQDAFPDNRIAARSIVASEDGCAFEAVFHGTHTGPLRVPTGEIAATGRPVQLRYSVVGEIAGGRWRRFDLYLDQTDLLGQLGLLPTPGAN